MQSVPDLYKHMLAVSYQMEVILEASAMAAALNRTVVFPRFYCWCDFDWYAVVLDGCAMGGRPGRNGADLFAMPFECPIDVILNPHNLYHSGFPYRQERWLTHSRLPAAVRNSREGVLVVDARDEATRAYRQQMVRDNRPFIVREPVHLGAGDGLGSGRSKCVHVSCLMGKEHISPA